ncbi:hypothetical protein [Natronorubrum sulfidifaciens]|uniref:Uncharacterized protein n=1 Tax=Natronorubrum sulfidifaciens JCM 14089 TaxID=1230460 RepID=L9W5W1_9EURY|nr:hypothetical protein [Natronorubrum sulfidifaciens]ELY44656.1 hypothetical protein C495_09749 [Natronorubrum sulfidifaciens JCM 14089]
MKYCLNCDWRASATDDSDRSPSRRAIDHHVETGHTVDSSDGTVPSATATIPEAALGLERSSD